MVLLGKKGVSEKIYSKSTPLCIWLLLIAIIIEKDRVNALLVLK